MEYKLCKFKVSFEDEPAILGGIAAYEDDVLIGVICGEYGSWIEAEDVEIIKTLPYWWSISEAILDTCDPDGTRGFRPEDQISMDFPDDVNETGYNPYIGGYDYDC